MTTQIITVTNDHFEWRVKDGNAYKHILSDQKISKLVKVTYDDAGNEVSREPYIEAPSAALAAWNAASPEEKKQMADDLKKYL